MKFCFYTTVFQRKEVTEMCFRGMKRFARNFDNVVIVACVSEKWAVDMCEKYNIKWVLTSNKPLGRKHNIGLNFCLRFKWDRLIQFGSDNLIPDRLSKYYKETDKDLFGVSKCVFLQADKAKMVDYDQMIGAGRCFKREVVEHFSDMIKIKYIQGAAGVLNTYNRGDVVYEHYNKAMSLKEAGIAAPVSSRKMVGLWDDDLTHGLDTHSNNKIFQAGFSNVYTPEYVYDIKSSVNIWKYEDFEGEKFNVNITEIPEYATDWNIRQKDNYTAAH